MGFFKDLTCLGTEVQWSMSINVNQTGQLKMTIRLLSGDITEKAINTLSPMNFQGTAEEFDSGLIVAMKTPVANTLAFFQNCREHQATLEAAKKQADADRQKNTQVTKNKEGKDKQEQALTKEKEEKNRKFEAIMKKIDQLVRDAKYGQAIAQLPNEKDFPDHKNRIESKRKELRSKHPGFDLFDQTDSTPETIEPAEHTTSLSDDPIPSLEPGELGESDGLVEPADHEEEQEEEYAEDWADPEE